MRRWWRDAPLGRRLTVLYMGLLAGLLVAVGISHYVETRSFLHDSTALRQRAQAKPVIDFWLTQLAAGGVSQPDLLERIAPGFASDLTTQDTTALVLDQTGAVVADGGPSSTGLESASPDPGRVAHVLAAGNDLTYQATVGGQHSLILLIPLKSSPNHPETAGVVQLTTTLALADEVLWRERLAMLITVPIALALGGLGCLWLTRSALAPLRRMVVTCHRISAGHLGGRVDLPRQQDEIGELALAFDDMATQIETAFAAQRRFVADAAHELRTPLAALLGSLEVLALGAQDDPTAARALIPGMYREAVRLNRLAGRLLDISRLEAQAAIQLQAVDLPLLLTALLPRARLIAPHQALQLERGESSIVPADPDRLQQALLHLVENAAQHSAPGGVIRLGWRCTPSEVELWVADDGEGIAATDLPHIFEPFYRGERGRDRRQGGAGLGLAVVRSILEAHGGKVRVDSQTGRGARFTLTLPLPSPER